MRDPVLTDAERQEALPPLQAAGWQLTQGGRAIAKDYRFKNFQTAFGWMTTCAIAAEKLDHHPEWSNVYNRVSVLLTTHDSDGLTWRDVKLAGIMDASADPIQQR